MDLLIIQGVNRIMKNYILVIYTYPNKEYHKQVFLGQITDTLMAGDRR